MNNAITRRTNVIGRIIYGRGIAVNDDTGEKIYMKMKKFPYCNKNFSK